VALAGLGADLRVQAAGWCVLVGSLDEDRVARRPAPGVWSAVEYTCHMADVLDLYRERIARALAEDEPVYEPVDVDEWARRRRYAERTVQQACAGLRIAAQRFAAQWEAIAPEAWSRRGLRDSYAEGSGTPAPGRGRLEPVDIAWMARQSRHEMHHHLIDVRRGQAADASGG
jgi:S-DNA-T family DNA segregation ATPase FtsK/SpoIIIE